MRERPRPAPRRSSRATRLTLCLLGLVLTVSFASHAGAQDDGVIRLGSRAPETGEPAPSVEETDSTELADAGAPRGFDYERFQTRLESLWFQRKAFLADGADEKAAEQGQLIIAFCREEGIRRLEPMAGALLAETRRHLESGHYNRALAALELAAAVDPGRPQIHFARSSVYWKAQGRNGQAMMEWARGVSTSLTRAVSDLSLFRGIALTFAIALAGAVFLFSLLMVVRYQLPFRHEVEEITLRYADERLARPAGWLVLALPLLVPMFIGWVALYWIAIMFRFMSASERRAAVVLLAGLLAALPVYRGTVAVYGLTADPVVRTTLASSNGDYDPDRIVRLRKLVDAHPEDAVYRFLLGGLYKNGRFFEEAFEAYKKTIELDPSLEQAHINIGNIFFLTGQWGEAVAHYTKAVEIDPDSVLALFNLHLAQAESFRFKEAEATLRDARMIDFDAVATLMGTSSGKRRTVIDAQLEITSVWTAALGGHEGTGRSAQSIVAGLANPVGLGAVATLFACFGLLFMTRHSEPARRCIRCGNAFCEACKRNSEGREYCTQCLHLYILGDGLALETKTKKLYLVQQYERRARMFQRLLSWTLPGTAQLHRGRALIGTFFMLIWLAALAGALPAMIGWLDRLAGVGLGLDLLRTPPVPMSWTVSALGICSVALGVAVWIVGNTWTFRQKEA